MGRKKHHRKGEKRLSYKIDEAAARRAKEANSFKDYKEGSATAEYQSMIAEAKEIAEAQKENVDAMHHDKIDKLLNSYCKKLAANMNKRFEIDARVPSIMIAGPSKFPTKKKEKQNAAREKNWQEYEYIQGLLDKIKSVGLGGIRSDDPDAVEKLRERIHELLDKQDEMKKINAYYRKHKTCKGYPDLSDEDAAEMDKRVEKAYSWEKAGPFKPFELTNNNANIKRLKARLLDLEQQQEQGANPDITFDGGTIVDNEEMGRVQIFFDNKPEEDVRTDLKKRGFKWAPSVKAWQRMRTPEALKVAKMLCGIQ